MGLNDVVSAERLHIGFFGMRNAGKSSLVNTVTAQELSVVSDVKGTTTDPVKKAMELLPLGPVVVIDTPGMDDIGELGELRVKKAKKILAETNIAVLVVDALVGQTKEDKELISLFEEHKIPYIIAYNKADLLKEIPAASDKEIYVSALTSYNIEALKEKMAAFNKAFVNEKRIVADLLEKGDTVLLVVPIDESAPKGRLILPQQQTIRDILDAKCIALVCQDTELKDTLNALKERPKIVITDSQAFEKVDKDTPLDILLTSFSILFARYKGELIPLIEGAAKLKSLKDGDKILISEGCSHKRQCNDIGTVKMPAWINNFTGKKLSYEYSSGGDFPEDLSSYSLIVHCGGCMLNEKAMKHRISAAQKASVPIVNYGIAIAEMHGILRRSLSPFPDVLKLLDADEDK